MCVRCCRKAMLLVCSDARRARAIAYLSFFSTIVEGCCGRESNLLKQVVVCCMTCELPNCYVRSNVLELLLRLVRQQKRLVSSIELSAELAPG